MLKKWLGRNAAVAFVLAALAFAAPLGAQEVEPSDEMAQARQFVDSLSFKTGDFHLAAADATLRVGDGFHYLEAIDAQRVLEDFWGNPKDPTVLGLVLPQSPSLLDDGSWAVVVTYVDEGYVTDADASDVDYDELLADMKEGAEAENAARREAGYPGVDIVGWATAPHYDNTAKKIYWARELAFDGETQHTLNYDIRVLGRSGYLSLSAISTMSELAAVETGMQRVLAFTEFDQGQRYADYDASTDKIAGYGVAALIGGALATKAGLFAKIGALLLAGKKILIPLLVLGGGVVMRLFKRKDPAAPPRP